MYCINTIREHTRHARQQLRACTACANTIECTHAAGNQYMPSAHTCLTKPFKSIIMGSCGSKGSCKKVTIKHHTSTGRYLSALLSVATQQLPNVFLAFLARLSLEIEFRMTYCNKHLYFGIGVHLEVVHNEFRNTRHHDM